MSAHAKQYPHEFERAYGERTFEGVSFFPTRQRAQEVAAEVRSYYRVPCRAIVIEAGATVDERYVVMLPVDGLSEPLCKICNHAAVWIREQETESEETTDGI